MSVLQPSEYNFDYFNGGLSGNTHPAGYTNYGRMQYDRTAAGFGFGLEESTGNMFGDLIQSMNYRINGVWNSRTVLVLGCAYGYEVKALRDLGIEAYGIDVSTYAISQADPSIAQYLQVQDAQTYLPTLPKNAYNYIFSRGFLECMSDADLASLLLEMERVSKSGEMHIISTTAPPEHYNIKTLQEWAVLDWGRVNVSLIINDDFENYVIA